MVPQAEEVSVVRIVRAETFAATIDSLVQLIGRHEVQPFRLELQIHAVGIVVSAIIAVQEQVTAAGFQLKGTGWYVTDFRDNNKGGAPSANKGDGASPASSSPVPAE